MTTTQSATFGWLVAALQRTCRFLSHLISQQNTGSKGDHITSQENRSLKSHEVSDWLIRHVAWLIRRTERIEDKLNRILHRQENDMSTKEEILAKVTAIHGMAQSIAVAVDELNGEFATISEQIDDLKRQIAEGQTVDLTELEAKIDETAGVVAGLGAAVKANPNP